MKRPSLFLAAMVAAVVLAAGLAACGGSDDNGGGGGGGKASFDLTIGDSVPLSGDLADYGPPGDKAAKVAVAQINKAIKSNGSEQTVKLVTEDNETSPQGATQAARKLVADGASCIAGAWASSDTIPTARSVTIPEGVMLISPASTADEISTLDDNGLVARTSPPDRFQGPTLTEAISKDLGGAKGKTVNIGARNDAYGNGLVKTFGDAWKKAGGTVGQTVVYDPTQPSYNSEAQQLVSGSPDATVIFDFPETFVKVGPALERTGKWDPTTAWGTDGLASSDLPGDVGESTVEGMRGTAPGVPDTAAPSKAFDKLYTSSAPKDVDRQTFDAQNFDAVMLCYLAAVAAGSSNGEDIGGQIDAVSGPPGKQYAWDQLPQAVKALENGDDIDYVGASGSLDLNDQGDPESGVYDIYQFKGGEINIIGEEPVGGAGG